MPPVTITLEELSEYFHLPEKKVAAQLGMCLTSLKKICRGHGITRWPFRKLKSLERTMQKMKEDNNSISFQLGREGAEVVMTSSRCSESSCAASRASSPCPRLIDENLHSNPPHDWRPSNSPLLPSDDCEEILQETERSSDPVPQPKQDKDLWPSFALAGGMHTLVITNWSILWTVCHLNKHILKPFGGIEMTVSDDGSNAYLRFPNPLAALHARKVCEDACALLQDSSDVVEADASRPVQLAVRCTSGSEEGQNTAIAVTPRHRTLHHEAGNVHATTPRLFEPQPAKISPLSGHQHDSDEGMSWTIPLAPATFGTGAAPMAGGPLSLATPRSTWACVSSGPSPGGSICTSRWEAPVSSVSLGPQSCGSLSCGSGDSSSVHSEFEWSAHCLVSC